MFWTFVYLGIVAAQIVYAYYTRPDEERARSAGMHNFNFPRATNGDPIALAYGTVRIDSPPVIMFRLDGGTPIVVDGVAVGVDHLIRMRLLLCRSNALVTEASPPPPALKGFYIGDRYATLDGPDSLNTRDGIVDPAGAPSYYIDEPSGDASDGATRGHIIFYDGRWDIVRHLAEAIEPDATGAVPYRGFITMRLWSWHVAGPQMAPYSPVIFNPVVIPGYESQTGPIGMGDCNPAAVLYDLFTNPSGGVASDDTLIDVDSFVAAAIVLADEQHGISLYITQAHTARDIVELILRQIEGVAYVDMATGKIVLKLIREDYDPLTIPEFTINNSAPPEMPTTLWEGTYNEVVVVYTDPHTDHRPETATARDPANIAVSGGVVRQMVVEYPGVRSSRLANILANRELNAASRPIATIQVIVNREGHALKPGDPFRVTWSPWGLSMIFRVTGIDLGTLQDGRITITAVQDRFAIVGTIFDPPVEDDVLDPPATPDPIQARIITEAPRFVQVQAFDAGLLNNPDAQRGYYLGYPEGSDSRYRVDAARNLTDEIADMPARAFPGTFVVDVDYGRDEGPYDVATGLVIRDVAGWTPEGANVSEIATEGQNLIQIGGEILAFQTVTDNMDGTYTLELVWRGLMDTIPGAPADNGRPTTIAAGTKGYKLPGDAGVSAMGKRVYRHADIIATHTPAAAGSTWTPNQWSPADSFTIRSRVRLPARAANVLVNSSETPTALADDGVTITWTDRNATTLSIKRGDAADEALESGQTFFGVAYKGDGPQLVIAASPFTSHTQKLPLGLAGHGLLEVGVDTTRSVTLPDGDAHTLTGWQVPTVPVLANHWRQMLINPRFTDGLTYWTTTSGTPTVGSGALGLGGAGSYLTGTTGTVTIEQDVDITGYEPGFMTAVLDFYTTLLTDAASPDDTVTVVLSELDGNGDVVADTTYGPLTTATWTKQTLTLLLGFSCRGLRVSVTLTPEGTGPGPDTIANTAVADLCLRVGQVSGQLLSNASFEAGGGGTTSWTATSGTWQVLSAIKYDGTYYVRPNDLASAELTQTPALPNGHELAAAVLQCSYANDVAGDTGETVLEALDTGGSVLSSSTTGALSTSPGGWTRLRLTIDPIPALTTHLRVRLVATRTSGTQLNACWDDFDLRTHKHLDPEQTIEAEWSESAAQPLPHSAMEWKFRYPSNDADTHCPPPTYALYAGTADFRGLLGVEPLLMATGSGAFAGARFVNWDGTSRTTTAYEGGQGTGARIELSPINASFANFGTTTDFTVVAFFKVRPGAELADGFGVCGRMSNSVGWQLRVSDTDGFARVRIVGDSGTAEVTGTVSVADGTLHAIVLRFDASAELLTMDAAGETDTASTAAIGEFATAVPGKFRILMAAESESVELDGQVALVGIWREHLTDDQVADCLRLYQGDASGRWTSDGRVGSIACVTGTGSTGPLCEVFGPGRPAIGYDADADRYGLVTMPEIINLIGTEASIDNVGGGTVATGQAVDPFGFKQAIRINGTDAEGRQYTDINFGPATTVHVTWFAKSNNVSSHIATVTLVSAGTSDVHTYTVDPDEWQVFTWEAAWDGGGGTPDFGSLLFSGGDASDDDILLSPIIYCGFSRPYPGTLPIGAPGATLPIIDVTEDDDGDALASQVNREGELLVEVALTDADCAIADLHNGTNSNDRRTILWDADPTTPRIKSDHYDGSAAANSNAQINSTTVDPTEPWTARLRWNRASTLDGITYLVVIRAEQGATLEKDPGRNTTWTASTTPVDVLQLGAKTGGSEAMAGIVYGLSLKVREPKVGD